MPVDPGVFVTDAVSLSVLTVLSVLRVIEDVPIQVPPVGASGGRNGEVRSAPEELDRALHIATSADLAQIGRIGERLTEGDDIGRRRQ